MLFACVCWSAETLRIYQQSLFKICFVSRLTSPTCIWRNRKKPYTEEVWFVCWFPITKNRLIGVCIFVKMYESHTDHRHCCACVVFPVLCIVWFNLLLYTGSRIMLLIFYRVWVWVSGLSILYQRLLFFFLYVLCAPDWCLFLWKNY